MAYVEWHDTVRNHPKTDALMLALKIPRREAVGIIGCLSSWTIQYRPGGRIEVRHISTAVEWDGSNGGLVTALVEVGWLDRIDDNWVQIHDWKDITRGYRKAQKDARRKRREYEENLRGVSTENKRGSAEKTRVAPRSDRNDLIGSERNGSDLNGTSEPRAPDIESHLSIKSGTIEHQLTADWNRGTGFPISQDRGAKLVRCTIDAGADPRAIESDFWNQDKCRGKKIWQVLDPLIPTDSDRKWTELVNWAKSEDSKRGGNGADR
jgi:hypothetical protein